MKSFRQWLSLVESANAPPALFYHGTNMAAACLVLHDGFIRADNPVDDDDLGAVVCVSSSEDVGHMFAVEFARVNSEYPVGVVFTLDAGRIMRDFDPVPYQATTAGSNDEHEYRVEGDLDLRKYCRGIRLVGDLAQLRNRALKDEIFDDWARGFNYDRDLFNLLWARLLRRASR